MCEVLTAALIGVGALALLGGGNAGPGCDNCPTGPACAVTQYGNYTVTIPQLAGEGTNVMQVPVQNQFAYAQHAAPAPYAGQSFASAPQPAAPYGAIGHYDAAPAAAYGQSAIGAGAYASPGGVGVGANVGAFDANVGVGARAY